MIADDKYKWRLDDCIICKTATFTIEVWQRKPYCIDCLMKKYREGQDAGQRSEAGDAR